MLQFGDNSKQDNTMHKKTSYQRYLFDQIASHAHYLLL